MAVRDGQAFLAEAIQSILAQTFRDFEFIIVDDGSADDTSVVIDKYRSLDTRIKTLRIRKAGLARALNKALQISRGQYIARMDADDISDVRRLERQVAELDRRPGLVALGTAAITINANGSHIRKRRPVSGSERISCHLMTRNVINHPSVMMRSSTLKEIGGYRVKFENSQDYDLWLRLIAVGEVDNLSESLLYYRKHRNRMSKKSKRSRRTLFSVAAIADHFARKAGRRISDKPLGADAAEIICDMLISLLSTKSSNADKKLLVRHILRFLRNVEGIPAAKGRALRQAIWPYTGLADRLKMIFYRI